jgi:deazaflavin-dependent oxidoreductase (nitroreductase family)
MAARYLAPNFGATIFNAFVRGLAGLGVSVYGSTNLAVRGRRTGAWQVVPVNVLEHDGASYLVAPRGETQWVRNLRASGRGEFRMGRRVREFTATEMADDAKPPILRAYLQRWAFEVAAFFPGVSATSSDTELRAIAAGYPVFRVSRT